MAFTIKPFRATYYNPELIKNPSLVVCPPYDVISKKQLVSLRKKSPYNFSNILLADNGDYSKTRVTLEKWLKEKILIKDKEEAFFLYEQTFNVDGKLFKRSGILSLLKMDKKDIFPHEYTLKKPKEDRKKIIKAVEANLSPIFAIAAGYLDIFSKIRGTYFKKKAFLEFTDSEGNNNKIWRIADKKDVRVICRAIDKSKLVIADGHHRFEVSYDYFKKNKDKFEDLNYILAYITDCRKGLVILPTHRIIDIEGGLEVYFDKLRKYFTIKEVAQDFLERKIRSKGVFCFGIYKGEKFYFLRLKESSVLDKIKDKEYRQLDTYVFHQLVLSLFKIRGDIKYTHSMKEAKLLAGKKKTAFLLRAVELDSVLTISSRGFRLPQKSTYFYPKLLSGIVIRKF